MKKILFRLIVILILAVFVCESIFINTGYAQVLPLTGSAVNVGLAENFHPVMVRGMKINPDNGLNMSFIVDAGDCTDVGNRHACSLQNESEKLIKYFLAALTIPEKDLWVNLSPYEKDRITTDALGKTEMGRDMLALDYMLKQMTSALLNPEDETGKTFWNKVHTQVYEKYGQTDLPVESLNKVWIMPDTVEIFAQDDTVLITKSRMKVMLEGDYLATDIYNSKRESVGEKTPDAAVTDDVKNILRDVIIPVLEDEVNEGEHFAQLRQIFNSLILAKWFKDNLKTSILNRVYSNQEKISGVDHKDANAIHNIYEQYLQAFRKGSEGLIKEDYDPKTQSVLARKYVTGGEKFDHITYAFTHPDVARISFASNLDGPPVSVSADFSPAMMSSNSKESEEPLFTKSRFLDNPRFMASMFGVFVLTLYRLNFFMGNHGAFEQHNYFTDRTSPFFEIDHFYLNNILIVPFIVSAAFMMWGTAWRMSVWASDKGFKQQRFVPASVVVLLVSYAALYFLGQTVLFDMTPFYMAALGYVMSILRLGELGSGKHKADPVLFGVSALILLSSAGHYIDRELHQPGSPMGFDPKRALEIQTYDVGDIVVIALSSLFLLLYLFKVLRSKVKEEDAAMMADTDSFYSADDAIHDILQQRLGPINREYREKLNQLTGGKLDIDPNTPEGQEQLRAINQLNQEFQSKRAGAENQGITLNDVFDQILNSFISVAFIVVPFVDRIPIDVLGNQALYANYAMMNQMSLRNAKLRKGGIDFDTSEMTTKSSGRGVEINIKDSLGNIDPAMIQGFVPVNIRITPITNIGVLFGKADNGQENSDSSLDPTDLSQAMIREENTLL